MKFEEIIKQITNNTPELLDIPELMALKDRIQPCQYHPEGDAYVHTLLAIKRARELTDDPRTWFAALVHDFGKAVTDNNNLPHQYNHETLGVPIVQEFCDRICAPIDYVKIAIPATREHLNIHRL